MAKKKRGRPPLPKTNQTALHLKLPSEMHERLAKLREMTGAGSVSEVIRAAIQLYDSTQTGVRPPAEVVAKVSQWGPLQRVLTDIEKRIDDNLNRALTDIKDQIAVHRDSPFAERLKRSRREKEFLARQIAPVLLQRCRRLASLYKRVYLVVDSGTTTYPLFGELGRLAAELRLGGAHWLNRVEVVTNSLAGMSLYSKFGVIAKAAPYAELSVPCRGLQGWVRPAFAALTANNPEQTREFLQSAIGDREKRTQSGEYAIGILTGNWVMLERAGDGRVTPIPLARGPGHLDFKAAVANECEETVVLSTLGKVLVDVELAKVNELLREPEREDEYRQPSLEESAKGRLSIVTTDRGEQAVLARFGARIRELLRGFDSTSAEQEFIGRDVGRPVHLVFQFDPPDTSLESQLAEEFPPRRTQDDKFLALFLAARSRGAL